jgi:phytoene dehydrogenase-like protein
MKNSATDIVIIGAGIAGLAAGCYAQMNGYRTQIFEMHDRPGGLCTAWQRQGFVFDGCIHYLFGSGRGQPFYRLWEELGVVPAQQFFHHEELLRVSEPNGKTLIVYCNPDRLEQHLIELSPIDRHLIRDFCAGIRTFTNFDLSLLQQQPKASMRLSDWGKLAGKMLPFMCPLAQWGNLSAAEFANRFQDPFLRRAIPQMFSWDSIPVMVGMSLLAYMHTKNAGFPLGGSLQFAEKIASRYLELGGEIHYDSQVEKILIENHKAIGVRLYNNEKHLYDRSIYNAEEMQESQILIDVLERFYPGIKNDIEFVDVATPLTYERYTGNWQGATCGWLLTKQTLPLSIKGLPKTLPKLRNFYALA